MSFLRGSWKVFVWIKVHTFCICKKWKRKAPQTTHFLDSRNVYFILLKYCIKDVLWQIHSPRYTSDISFFSTTLVSNSQFFLLLDMMGKYKVARFEKSRPLSARSRPLLKTTESYNMEKKPVYGFLLFLDETGDY